MFLYIFSIHVPCRNIQRTRSSHFYLINLISFREEQSCDPKQTRSPKHIKRRFLEQHPGTRNSKNKCRRCGPMGLGTAFFCMVLRNSLLAGNQDLPFVCLGDCKCVPPRQACEVPWLNLRLDSCHQPRPASQCWSHFQQIRGVSEPFCSMVFFGVLDRHMVARQTQGCLPGIYFLSR